MKTESMSEWRISQRIGRKRCSNSKQAEQSRERIEGRWRFNSKREREWWLLGRKRERFEETANEPTATNKEQSVTDSTISVTVMRIWDFRITFLLLLLHSHYFFYFYAESERVQEEQSQTNTPYFSLFFLSPLSLCFCVFNRNLQCYIIIITTLYKKLAQLATQVKSAEKTLRFDSQIIQSGIRMKVLTVIKSRIWQLL